VQSRPASFPTGFGCPGGHDTAFRFEKKDIEKERKIIVEEISMSKDAPNQLVGMILDDCCGRTIRWGVMLPH